jgi:hypothetical protein
MAFKTPSSQSGAVEPSKAIGTKGGVIKAVVAPAMAKWGRLRKRKIGVVSENGK